MDRGKTSWLAALLDILGALCVFAALSVFFILWRPGRTDVAFLVHLLCTLAWASASLPAQCPDVP